MNRIAFFFKSKAYKEGFRAGEKDARLTSISNMAWALLLGGIQTIDLSLIGI